MNFKAIIFDVDGILLDSEPLHRDAWKLSLDTFGHAVSENELISWTGIPCVTMAKQLAATLQPRRHWQEYVDTKENFFRRFITEQKPLFPDLVPLLSRLQSYYILGYATSSSKVNIDLMFSVTGIAGFFTKGVTMNDVTHHKPHPETYAKAADRLDIAPGQCVAVEDSLAGMESAKRAGMTVFGVTTSFPASSMEHADFICGSTAEACNRLIEWAEER